MIEEIAHLLHRTRNSLKDACEEAGVKYDPNMNTKPFAQCDHCSYWFTEKELHKDRGGMLICDTCEEWYGN